ncbi:ATPase [Campylobacterota bacterium]|nr:ATPase [Campylobacterota bacterium]
MQRNAIARLVEWKNKIGRKPLVMWGARQVGKTWLAKEFGRQSFQNTVYINFDIDRSVRELFDQDLYPQSLIKGLEGMYNAQIDPAKTLIIFDEVQECNRALVLLKYFQEIAPEYHIVAAGSFLGVATHQGNSFPVGKVDMITIYPMSFDEFLVGIGEEKMSDILNELNLSLIAGVSGRFASLLKTYFYVGGMPEAVETYAQTKDFNAVREVQNRILTSYRADFSKHIASTDIPKARMIWETIPLILGRENKKFQYSQVKSGGSAREFETALDWLVHSGLVYRVHKIKTPNLPLSSYQENEHFKLYMLDVGLLAAAAALDIKTLLAPNNDLFTHFKGALTEQFVCQELKATDKNYPLFYWKNDKGMAEVDFVIQYEDQAIPIEVKAGENVQSKSLSVYRKSYQPLRSIRTSLKNYGDFNGVQSIPLYLIGKHFTR